MLEAADLAFVNAWQRSFPLCRRPFLAMASAEGTSESQVLGRLRALQRQGVIDRVGPVFRPNVVGASTLAAMAVPPERLEAVAAQVSAQPGVNHNYEREHRFNLWFVATGASKTEVRQSIVAIEQATGLPVLTLPLLEEFHIDLGFDLDTNAAPRGAPTVQRQPLNAKEKRLVACVSAGLPLVSEPYAEVAAGADLAEQEALALLKAMLDDGRIRRIGAVIRHRRLGYTANAMVVWDVPDSEASALGRRLSTDDAVTLCYRRARAVPHWRYNLYCMVHGRQREKVLQDVERISATHGLLAYAREVLFSARCFSQRAARYG